MTTMQSGSVTTPTWSTDAMSTNQTEKPNDEFHVEIFEAIIYTLVMIGAFFANVVAITTILKTKALRRNHHNLLILNLNIIDLGVTLLSMTFSVGSFFDDGLSLINSYPLCRLNGFFAMTFTVGNFTSTMCIAIDRYVTVVWSKRFPPTRRRVVCLLVINWVISVLLATFPTAEILSNFVYTRATHHCSPAWKNCAYYIIWFVYIYAVTVPVMAFCYGCVFRVIRQQDRNLRAYEQGAKTPGFSDGEGGTSSEKSREDTSESAPDVETKSRVRRAMQERVSRFDRPSNGSSSGVYSQEEHRRVSFRMNPIYSGAQSGGSTESPKTDQGISPTGELCVDGQNPSIHMDRKEKSSLRKQLSVKSKVAENTDMEICGGQRDIQTTTIEDPAERKRKRREKRRLIKKQKLGLDKQVALTGVLLVLTTVLCWTPYNIVHACFLDINLGHVAESLTMWIAYLNSLLDPLIYTFMNRKARAARKEYTQSYRNALSEASGHCADGVRSLGTRILDRVSGGKEHRQTAGSES
ncbi:uncharacterized protein [Diadema setosum]|uniref:uncharacterized protein n=1 Tax=Diadema setosum TaxID=31175 RepID=UPI003B3B92BE